MTQASETLVSIGMPVYNSSHLIRRALESVLAQDHERFELIICDDASTDNSFAICQLFAQRDARIRLFSNPTNLGLLANFHRVLASASGEYFMWAAHDDYRDNNYVSALLGELEAHPEVGLACSRYVRVTPGHEILSTHPFPEPAAPKGLPRLKQFGARASASWAYGLYRTGHLRRIFERVYRVGLAWFSDYLILWDLLLNQAVLGTNRTTFYQVKTGQSAVRLKPRSAWAYAHFTARVLPFMMQSLQQAPLPAMQKIRLLPYIIIYLELHLYYLRRTKQIQLVRRRFSS